MDGGKDLVDGEVVEHGQTDEAVREGVRIGALRRRNAPPRTEGLIVETLVKREVVEDAGNLLFLHALDKVGSRRKVREDEIEHVRVVGGTVWDVGKREEALVRKRFERLVVTVPEANPAGLDILEFVALGTKESRGDFRRQEGTPGVHPTVFIDFATEEFRTVGPFFPDNLGTADEPGIVDGQKPTFATDDVLRFMKGETSQMPDGTKGATPLLTDMEGLNGLGGILHHQEVVLGGQIHDGIHVAGHAGVVNGDDDLGARRDKCLDGGWVNVGVGSLNGIAVGKNELGTLAHKGKRGGDEGIGRNDDLITGTNLSQDCGHFQGIGTGSREQSFTKPIALLKEPMTPFCEIVIATQPSSRDGLADELIFLPRQMGSIEWNGMHGMSLLTSKLLFQNLYSRLRRILAT